MQPKLKRCIPLLAVLCVAALLVAPAQAAKPTPPAAPTNLTATAVSSTQIDLDWDDNSEPDLDHYNIHRSTTSRVKGNPSDFYTTCTPSNYSDMAVSAGTTYYYKVLAVDTAGDESDPSNEASATPAGDTTPPAAPTNLSASVVSGSQIDLDWDDNTEGDLDGYNVYRDTSSGVPVDAGYQIATGVASSSYSDTTVDDQTTYYYVVTAVDTASNESAASNEASATTPDETPPAAPTNLTATGVSQSQIDLDWDDSPEPDWSHYNVYRDTSSGFTCDVNTLLVSNVTGSAYSDLSLPMSTTYYYKVTAVDTSYNESGASNEASATTLGDTTPPAAPTNLSATAVSYDQIDLDWDDNTEGDLSHYNVYRGG
ncbi:MAG: fibronectin type III domain-containing protein, partial [Phycisphaerae bacterium]